ncbi:hypothetical protein diail_614 [Diaporthe ilicicola]|nr:hypothetical protein diail_614 [Diaporthe ilicicola]
MDDKQICFCFEDVEEPCDECKIRNLFMAPETTCDDTLPSIQQTVPKSHADQQPEFIGFIRDNTVSDDEVSGASDSDETVDEIRDGANHSRHTVFPRHNVARWKPRRHAQQQGGETHCLYDNNRYWERINQDSNHGPSCARVSAGLVPILGALFHECKIAVVPADLLPTQGRLKIGSTLAKPESREIHHNEMLHGVEYEVRITRFSKPAGYVPSMTTTNFDHIPRQKLPSLRAALTHLLLFLGSRGDRRSTYRMYRGYITRNNGSGGTQQIEVLFGVVRFPSRVADPATATEARMVNLTSDDAPLATVPSVDGPDSWRRFCLGPFRAVWQDIVVRGFEYESYEPDVQGHFMPPPANLLHAGPGPSAGPLGPLANVPNAAVLNASSSSASSSSASSSGASSSGASGPPASGPAASGPATPPTRRDIFLAQQAGRGGTVRPRQPAAATSSLLINELLTSSTPPPFPTVPGIPTLGGSAPGPRGHPRGSSSCGGPSCGTATAVSSGGATTISHGPGYTSVSHGGAAAARGAGPTAVRPPRLAGFAAGGGQSLNTSQPMPPPVTSTAPGQTKNTMAIARASEVGSSDGSISA